MLTAMIAAAALLAPLQDATPEPEAVDAPLQVDQWLVIDGIQERGRRPLRPDAVFASHLLDPRGFEPPVEGQQLTGESGTGAWAFSERKDNGGPESSGDYAYGTLEIAPEDAGVYLARLRGAWQLYVNGRPHVGDAYRYGFDGVPVELVAGTNHVFVTGARGGFGLTFETRVDFVQPGRDARVEVPDQPLQIVGRTAPQIVLGEAEPVLVGLVIQNESKGRFVGVSIAVDSTGYDGGTTLHPIEGLETRVIALGLRPKDANSIRTEVEGESPDSTDKVEISLLDGAGRPLGPTTTVTIRRERPDHKRVRTFRSSIDGSVQHYGEVPPSRTSGDELPGLVLSLHGASVGVGAQIGAYGHAPDLWVVAPTNRRPFGFDWQDWGRLDAYEVRDTFVGRNVVDPRRRYLTGHSMGGHGTWHLAANDPDQWAVVAPSAGWRTFDTYGGRPAGTLTEWWHRADAASNTEAAVMNLRQLPTFVLHGDADRTVRVSEAQAMLELLEQNDAVDVRHHFEEGKGHWWDGYPEPGAACVQWPDMFAMFTEYELEHRGWPLADRSPRRIEFRTVDPAVDSDHYWVSVLDAHQIGRPSELRANGESEERIEIETLNVRRLGISPTALHRSDLVIDGQAVAVPEIFEREPGRYSKRIEFVHSGSSWRAATEQIDPGRRRPGRSGPFKRAFENEFVLVRGTAGEPEETAALLDLARYHVAEWWYRANGRALLMTDVEFMARPDLAHNNVILYGNADTNAAWDAVVDPACQLRARRGGIQLGGDFLRGFDRAAQFVHRRKGSDRALVGVFADGGPLGTRMHMVSAPFVSGVGIPDFLVFDSGVLSSGDDASIVTGFWDHDWRLDRSNLTGF